MVVLIVLQIVFYLNPGPCSVHTSYLKVFESDVASLQALVCIVCRLTPAVRCWFQLSWMRPGCFGALTRSNFVIVLHC